MGNHRTIAGALQLILGLTVLIVAGLLFGGFFTGTPASANRAVTVISQSVSNGVGIFLILLALAFCISGFGLMKRLSWSRPVAWVMAVVGLFVNVPIGTAISIYVIWVLVKKS